MDFDKENWLDDLTALRITCSEEGVPVAVERSRSGFGGHAWVLFSEGVPAIQARKLGSYLITRTMDKRYQMDMKSYDRLFPNQDTMPKGGFGNLIALPFQKEAVCNGNSVFIDEAGRPYPDQWDYLKSVREISYYEMQAIVDQGVRCHHVSAFSFEKVHTQAKAKYVLGLTATPYRRDGHQSIIHFQCGPVCHRIQQKDSSEQMNNACVLSRATAFSYDWKDDSKIHDLWQVMITDEQRNQLIVDDVIAALAEGRFPLILTERREHLEKLAELLRDKSDSLILLCGGLKQKKRQEVMEELRATYAESRRLIIATGSYIGEGFDEPRLDTLFLNMPSSFKGRIVQYAGRLHRQYADKQSIRIYDYVDNNVTVLAGMFRKRMKTYKLLGYTITGQS